MKKQKILIALVVIAVVVLTACTNQNTIQTNDLVTTKPASSLVGNTEKPTVLESTTVIEESKVTKTESTTQKFTEHSTTEKATTTTTKQSTTAKPTTTMASTTSTTKRVTTTQKPSTTKENTTNTPYTTKKVTTTKATTTEKAFDVNYWVSYAKNYAKSVGLKLNSSATDCWDNPINANPSCKYLERDIKDAINMYVRNEDITEVWVWAEKTGTNSYKIYIGYA